MFHRARMMQSGAIWRDDGEEVKFTNPLFNKSYTKIKDSENLL